MPNLKIPVFKTDEEAERFVDEADLSKYDLSGFRPLVEVLPELAQELAQERIKRSRGRPKLANAKQVVALRLSPITIARFKAGGDDWRARMVAILEEAK